MAPERGLLLPAPLQDERCEFEISSCAPYAVRAGANRVTVAHYKTPICSIAPILANRRWPASPVSLLPVYATVTAGEAFGARGRRNASARGRQFAKAGDRGMCFNPATDRWSWTRVIS